MAGRDRGGGACPRRGAGPHRRRRRRPQHRAVARHHPGGPRRRRPDTVRFKDTLTDVAIAYPATWVRRISNDQAVRILVSSSDASAGASVSVRKSGLTEEVNVRNLSAVRPLTDDLVAGDDRITAIADPVAVTVGGLPGYRYRVHVHDRGRDRGRARPLLPLQDGTARPARPAGRPVDEPEDAAADVRPHRRLLPGPPRLTRRAAHADSRRERPAAFTRRSSNRRAT